MCILFLRQAYDTCVQASDIDLQDYKTPVNFAWDDTILL